MALVQDLIPDLGFIPEACIFESINRERIYFTCNFHYIGAVSMLISHTFWAGFGTSSAF